MTRPFADTYLDEDVSVLVAGLLKARALVAVTARDASNLGRSDREQLEYAARHEMALLTHNRADFEALHKQWLSEGFQHWGILVAMRRPPTEIVERLLTLLNTLTADDLRNQLIRL